MPEIVLVLASLVCLMGANILIGTKLADLKKEYNKTKFWGGVSKALFTLIGLGLVYLATLIYPIEVATINNQVVTTLTGATILLKCANIVYGGKVLIKIKDMFKLDIPIEVKEIAEDEKEVG